MSKWKQVLRKAAVSVLAAAVVAGSVFTPGFGSMQAEAAAAAKATLTVDVSPQGNTGEIIHGAAGFLYGVSSENVPTTNTMVPLKSKILVTKGAVGTEHPYGDALDVAKTFLESGGQQVQMYNSNYYGVFGVTATIERYCDDLQKYIAPAVTAWKEAWKAEHGTPAQPKDKIGGQVDIDQAIVYVPINETTPYGDDANINRAWQSYRNAIKSVDANASLAGPNDWGYISEGRYKSFFQFCADNDCMPDVITWHELQTNCLRDISVHMDNFRNIWNKQIDWSAYNAAHNTSGVPAIPQICINEYAEMEFCGVPGRLVNWIARLEDEKITGCLPFWHQANNLNDLAAGANEGNGAWWLYKWYGDMSGTTQPVSTSTSYEKLYGVSTMDESKKISTTLLGGFSGDITVRLEHVADTETFKNASVVHAVVQETMFTGFHGAANGTPTILEGAYPIDEDGSVTLVIPNALFENAYNVTLTQAGEDELIGIPVSDDSGTVYEAEKAALSGSASATSAGTNPSYYMSNDGSGNRAVDMPDGAVMTYTVEVPADGKYKLDFAYGNGQGTVRNDMNIHNPVNLKQTFALDGGEAQEVTMESTLFQTMTGMKTQYYDLSAGKHTVTVTTPNGAGASKGLLLHDFVRVSYAGVYQQAVPSFHQVYEAELADVNRLLGNTDTTVSTQTEIKGYSGGGYVTGLSGRRVPDGGGIRMTVVVEESGLYNVSLRYHASANGNANIYVENTAVTLDRLNQTVALRSGTDWQMAAATIYLQKGINVVDVDTTSEAALDYMLVQALPAQEHSTIIEAENTIPAALSESIKVADSEGASGGKYVEGMKGSYRNPDYLEFQYQAPAAGKYQMQVFHSNEDLAGSHSYNIKATDKYAVVEVNGQSDSPKFTLADGAEEEPELYYFADCGDHNPATVSEGDKLGSHNSVTDQMYGADSESGYQWGLVMEHENEVETPGEGSLVTSEEDHAVYTNFQKALSNGEADLQDGKPKEATFRYAHNQGESGIDPRYVSYRFELEPGEYDVEVCMGNSWGNAGAPTITASAEGMEPVSETYSVPQGGTQAKKMTVRLEEAAAGENGRIPLSVKATSSDPTIQMNYIKITGHGTSEEEGKYKYLAPNNEKVLADRLPEGIYMGELLAGKDWFIDYRNMKNHSDRYFFINTFSDDTFREKTITLDLQAGQNTIRIYNDNSWNVTYGGTQSTPAETNLPNYTPNFDKFVITPIALATPVALEVSHAIKVMASSGGYITADKNNVPDKGSYTLNMRVEEGCTLASLLINGQERKGDIKAAEDGYSLTVNNVTADQEVKAYFTEPGIPKDTLQALYEKYKDLKKGTYSDASWKAFESAIAYAQKVLANEKAQPYQITDAYERLTEAVEGLYDIANLIYFVDCGDHNPSTLSEGDAFGKWNSVTDRLYGADSKSGYSWGLVMEHADEKETPGEGSLATSEDDKAVYTNFQKALSNSASDLADGQSKDATLRYAHGQDTAGINPRYISYRFELDPGSYKVTVGMSNTWGNASSPTVTLHAEGAADVSEQYAVAPSGKQEKIMETDLSKAKVNEKGRVELSVKATSTDPTIQMSYILIESKDSEVPSVIPVTKITVTGSASEWKVGETAELKADVEPANATDKNVTWKSSDEKVAVVSEKGVVTAKSAGKATITATAADGSGVSGTYQVIVTKKADEPKPVKVTKITLTGTISKLAAGKKTTLKATVQPSNAENKKVNWKTSNSKVAVVSGNGVVTAKGAGTATITAAAADGSGVKGTYKISVVKHAVKKVTLKSASKAIAAGKKATVKATVSTTGKSANKTLKWTSSNTKYATVSAKGLVTAKKAGAGKTVTIMAAATDGSGKKASVKIKIVKDAVKKITLKCSKKTVAAGKKATVKATVSTTGKTANKSLAWSTSNQKYATVNSKGVVTTKKAGKGKTVTIKAVSTDGTNKKATIKLKIK